MENSTASIIVYRQDPAVERLPVPYCYRLPLDEPTTVLRLLSLIFEQYDPALAYRRCNCYRGVCGACLLNANGRNLRACNVVVKPGDQITLRAAQGYPLIRDLVVDQSPRLDEGEDSVDPNAEISSATGHDNKRQGQRRHLGDGNP